MTLSQAGATTSEAEDGEQALRIVTELRALGYARPIIARTADAMQGDMSRCLASGCDDYLSKPIDKQKLFEQVVYFLGIRHTRQDGRTHPGLRQVSG